MSNSKCQFDRKVYTRNVDTGLRGPKIKNNPLDQIVYTPFFGKKEESKSLECDNNNQVLQGYLPGWLPLPMPSGDEFYGLFPVYIYSDNFLALLIDGTEDYQVDWGDGNIETFTAGTKAQHQYSYNDIDETSYYAKGDYRQVIVHITILNNGNMTVFDLDQKHDNQISYYCPWLNINVSAPNCAGNSTESLILGTYNNVGFKNLHRAGLYNLNSLTAFDDYIFNESPLLTTLEITGTNSLEYLYNIGYDYTYSLNDLPFFNTTNVTQVDGLSDYAVVEDYPLYDFSNVEIFTLNTTYYTCVVIPAWDLSSVTSTYSIDFENSCDVNVTGLRVGFSLGYYSRISTAGLVKLFNNLGTALGEQTITLSCNSSANLTAEEIEIATDKGFTVTIS